MHCKHGSCNDRDLLNKTSSNTCFWSLHVVPCLAEMLKLEILRVTFLQMLLGF